jgi:hypothetical protein
LHEGKSAEHLRLFREAMAFLDAAVSGETVSVPSRDWDGIVSASAAYAECDAIDRRNNGRTNFAKTKATALHEAITLAASSLPSADCGRANLSATNADFGRMGKSRRSFMPTSDASRIPDTTSRMAITYLTHLASGGDD